MSPPPRPEKPDNELQARLILSLFDEAHVSIWACDEDYKIVLWNQGAAETYGRSADSVLGRRYDELFIDPAEREQSLADCRTIIRDGTRFRNFLALDHDARNNERQMLTNCFRITDPETGAHYQAEIGVNIADLEVAQRELRTLRELGLRQMIEREQTLKIRKTHLHTILAGISSAVTTRAAERTEELERALRNVSRRLKADNASRYETRKRAVAQEAMAMKQQLAALEQRITSCSTVEETVELEQEIGTPPQWAQRIDRASRTRR